MTSYSILQNRRLISAFQAETEEEALYNLQEIMLEYERCHGSQPCNSNLAVVFSLYQFVEDENWVDCILIKAVVAK